MLTPEKFLLLYFFIALPANAGWLDYIYNTITTPMPPIPSGAAVAGAVGVCSLSYYFGKSNGQGDIIEKQNELNEATKKQAELKDQIYSLKKEVEFHDSRQTLIDFSKSDAAPQMKRAAEAMVAIDQSLIKTASKIEILNDNLFAKVNNTTSIISKDLTNLQSEVNNTGNYVIQALKGIFFGHQLDKIDTSIREIKTAIDRGANENKRLQNKNLEDYKKFQREHTKGIFTRLGFNPEPPPTYRP